MLEIVLNNVSKNYGNKQILRKVNFEIKTNEKVALIGPNGCGKTTILRMISKIENPTSGEVFTRKDAKIEILSQYPDSSLDELIVNDIIHSSFKELNELRVRLEKEEEKLTNGIDLDKTIIKYTRLQEEYMKNGGYEIDSKVDKLVAAFHVENLLDKKFKSLSGGEKTIISLICILLKEPDILLLDEPTNHLDISMLEWLEKYLSNCNKTILIVSHDRYFLDKVVNKVILIDNGEEEIFNGNYSYYLKENEDRVMREFNEYKNQQKQIEAMKASIKRLKEYGKLAYPCGEKFFRRAASIEKRLEKMEVLDKPKNNDSINLSFKVEQRSGNDIISFENFDLTIGDKELLKRTKCLIKYKEKVCIMGPNGTGKSTLIKRIISNDPNIKIGSNVKIGYIPQNITFENENKQVIEEARKYFIGPEEHLRSALTKFLFYSEGIFTRLNKLSGGERLRLKLFCLMQQDSNLLILDEPTNHIDINTKEILEEALKEYKGTIIMISHDRYFINKIATRIIMIENKKLVSYIGNYEDYKREKERNS
ncbi:MAG: ABC-F family ATP-binding cassette domain-containing protein [Bacilli bacterium]|nr:ABC-F family ATP-binding cassette domain-containing protein [Bacilli bacterium]